MVLKSKKSIGFAIAGLLIGTAVVAGASSAGGGSHVALAKSLQAKYGSLKENTNNYKNALAELIYKMWRSVGLSDASAQSYLKSQPWSAAFISYTMINGGYSDFPVSASHACFADKIRKGNYAKYKVHRIGDYIPKVGDIVLQWRVTPQTFDSLNCGDTSHSDIIVSKANGELTTIGGNVGDTISVTKVPLTAQGYIKSNKYILIIEVK